MSDKIETGSVVRLKSGGHKMVVVSVRGNDEADCVWFPTAGHFGAVAGADEPKLYAAAPSKESFPLACLEWVK